MTLTPAQQAVAELVAQRLSCQEIAERRRCSVATVHAHILATAQRIADSGYQSPLKGMKLIRRYILEMRATSHVERSA